MNLDSLQVLELDPGDALEISGGGFWSVLGFCAGLALALFVVSLDSDV